MPNEMDKQPIEVVNVTSPALNSRRGKYFIGKTGLLNFGGGYYAWGGIVNPALFFLSPGKRQVHARVAFGWWEEKA